MVSDVIKNVCVKMEYNIIIGVTLIFTFYLLHQIIIPRAERGFTEENWQLLKPIFNFTYNTVEFCALGVSVYLVGLAIFQYGVPLWQWIYFGILTLFITPIIFISLGEYLISLFKKYKK